jgi:hypothetical protein
VCVSACICSCCVHRAHLLPLLFPSDEPKSARDSAQTIAARGRNRRLRFANADFYFLFFCNVLRSL